MTTCGACGAELPVVWWGRVHPCREEIVEAMARLLFVCAYADFVEEPEQKEDVSDLPRPGPGEDWNRYAPTTTDAARRMAAKLAEDIERENGAALPALYRKATETCRNGHCNKGRHNLHEFGSCLAFQALGHGVSWFDDHAEFPLVVPGVTFYIFSRSDLDLTG